MSCLTITARIRPPGKLLPGQWRCFWCQGSFWKAQLTDDHVVPRYVGGANIHENIVRACGPCNTERSTFTTALVHARAVVSRTDRNAKRALKKYLDKLPWILDLQREWAAIEKERLGYSPSEAIVLPVTIKQGKQEKWARDAVLEEARRAAETRVAEQAEFTRGIA